MHPWFIEGLWRGEYAHHPPIEVPPVPFRMELQLGWFGSVRGSVQDESEWGTPDEGTIKGRISKSGAISFVKRIPQRYILVCNPVTGVPVDRPQRADGRHPLIHYRGSWDVGKKALLGTWTMMQQLPNSGTWSARPTILTE